MNALRAMGLAFAASASALAVFALPSSAAPQGGGSLCSCTPSWFVGFDGECHCTNFLSNIVLRIGRCSGSPGNCGAQTQKCKLTGTLTEYCPAPYNGFEMTVSVSANCGSQILEAIPQTAPCPEIDPDTPYHYVGVGCGPCQ